MKKISFPEVNVDLGFRRPVAASLLAAMTVILCLTWLIMHAHTTPLLGLAPTLLICLLLLAVKNFSIQLPMLLAFTYLPGHQLLVVVPWLLLAKEIFARGWFKVSALEVILGLWILISFFFNEGNPTHFLHYVIATWYWWAMLKWFEYHELPSRLFSKCLFILFAMQLMQFFFMVPQLAAAWPETHGDHAKGTMMSKNFYLGGKSIFLLLLAYYYWQYTRSKGHLILFGIFTLSWIITGLKTSVIAVFSVACLNLFSSRIPLILKVVAPVLLASVLFVLVWLVDSSFQNLKYINTWIWSIGKLKVFADTTSFFLENPIYFLMGLGPGQFLSRAALISTGGLDTQYSHLLPIVSNPFSDQLIYTTYTPALIEWSRGAILYSPNSSIIAVLTELGFPGFCLMAFGMISGLRRIKQSAIISENEKKILSKTLFFYAMVLVLLSFLDFWLEYPSVIIPAIVVFHYLRTPLAKSALPQNTLG